MQVAGPAYGALLNEWGNAFLTHGEIDVRFVAMVLEGQTVEVDIELAPNGTEATIMVENITTGHVAAVGSATREQASNHVQRSHKRADS
jgi:acyl dehydratase